MASTFKIGSYLGRSITGVLIMTSLAFAAKDARPTVIAHRGASGYLPEHTLPSASMAYAMGADFIEPDVVLTKDNIPIVLHDIHLDETTDVAQRFPNRKRNDGMYYAIDFTLKEIKQLKAHERVKVDTQKAVYEKRFPVGKSSFEIPTFKELIELVIGLNKSTSKNIGIYPEIKQPVFHMNEGKDIAKITHDLVKSYEKQLADAPVVWQCFHAETLKRFDTEFHSPYTRILLIDDGDLYLDEPDALDKQLSEVAKIGHGIGPHWSHIFDENGKSRGLVELSHKHKLLVHTYTVRVDDLPSYTKTLDELLNKLFNEEKVDGVFTDFSDKVLRYLEKN